MVWHSALCYALAVLNKGQVVVAEAVTWSSLCFALGSVAEAVTWSSTVPSFALGSVAEAITWSSTVPCVLPWLYVTKPGCSGRGSNMV